MNKYEAYMAARLTPVAPEDTQLIKPGMQFLHCHETWTITRVRGSVAFCTSHTGQARAIWVSDYSAYYWLDHQTIPRAQ